MSHIRNTDRAPWSVAACELVAILATVILLMLV